MAGQETSPGIYTPLDSSRNEIRLLEILPRSSDYGCDDTVHCRLIHSSLDSRPSYTAISYVWGDPKVTRAVVVNGQLVQITTNLADALQQFREDGVKILWADALCINQQDETEKSREVQRMRMIYQNAALVIGWLGIGDELDMRGRLAITNIARLADEAGIPMEMPPEPVGTPGGCMAPISQDSMRSWPSLKKRDTQLKDLLLKFDEDLTRSIRVFHADFWTRVWVIQEVCLAASVVVASGPSRVPWNELLTAHRSIRFVCELCQLYPSLAPSMFIDLAYYHRRVRSAAVILSNHIQSHGPNVDIRKIVGCTTLGNALTTTDTLDRVYALLGLMKDEDRLAVPVDYTMHHNDLFAKMTKYLLQRYGPDVLCLAGSSYRVGRSQDELPSWAQDWTYTDDRVGGPELRLPDLERPFAFQSPSERCITLKGARLDRVAKIIFYTGFVHDLVDVAFEAENHYFQTAAFTAAEADRLRKVMCRILLYDRFHEPWNLSASKIARCLIDFLRERHDQRVVRSRQERRNSEVHLTAAYPEHEEFPEEIGAPFNGPSRSVFVTDEGYVGCGPPETEIGDEVYCFWEGTWMYVLREREREREREGNLDLQEGDGKEGRRWELVGPSIVHGFIDDQEIRRFWESDPKLEDIWLE